MNPLAYAAIAMVIGTLVSVGNDRIEVWLKNTRKVRWQLRFAVSVGIVATAYFLAKWILIDKEFISVPPASGQRPSANIVLAAFVGGIFIPTLADATQMVWATIREMVNLTKKDK